MEQSEQNQEVSESYISQSQLPNSEEIEEITPASKSHKSLIITLVLLLLLTTGAAVYLFSQNQSLKAQLGLPTLELSESKQTCEYNGQVYQPGEGFTASDGCNSCSCAETGEVACTEMACVSDSELSVIQTLEDWETYSNSQYNVNFKYPASYEIEESLDNTYDRMQIYVRNTSTEDSFSISAWKDFLPDQATYFFDTEPISQETINGKDWNTYFLPCGYRDGANDAPCTPTYALQKVVGEILYTIVFTHQSSLNELQDQILSTFEFTD